MLRGRICVLMGGWLCVDVDTHSVLAALPSKVVVDHDTWVVHSYIRACEPFTMYKPFSI